MKSLTFPDAVALNVTFLLAATIVLLLRCNVRYRILFNHGKEDILVICAWVCLDLSIFQTAETDTIAGLRPDGSHSHLPCPLTHHHS